MGNGGVVWFVIGVCVECGVDSFDVGKCMVGDGIDDCLYFDIEVDVDDGVVIGCGCCWMFGEYFVWCGIVVVDLCN